MRLATRQEVFRIDRRVLEVEGISQSALVRKAGRTLAKKFKELYPPQKFPRVGVWCGPGNNGADGRIMAQVLAENGFAVTILEIDADFSVENFDVLVDALFGVGLGRPLSPSLQIKIQTLQNSRVPIVALDLPSGLDANTGNVLGCAVKARCTLAIAPAKPGLFLNEGPAMAGRVFSVDLGFSAQLLAETANTTFLVGAASARRLLPSRPFTANKTHFGHLLVVAGSEGMEGAALLVAEAAARMGCGYVTLCSASEKVFAKARPDFLRLDLKDFFKKDLGKYSAVVVGPGLGVSSESQKIVDRLIKHASRVLVDADALTLLAQKPKVRLTPEWILTPHAGELSRLLRIPAKDLEADRLWAAEKAQSVYGAAVLLKGFRTVLAVAGKRYIIGAGNVALAKAGSGDVLSGFVGSLMAQGLSTAQAGALGAYLHGRIADDWLRRARSPRTLMASDLPELIDASLRSLKNQR